MCFAGKEAIEVWTHTTITCNSCAGLGFFRGTVKIQKTIFGWETADQLSTGIQARNKRKANNFILQLA